MRLTDYVYASESMKRAFFNSLVMQYGLRYFGGKTHIGKYLLNRIFEMQAYRYITDGLEPAKVFIDAFAGGGKLGLTIPTGWFETIVINDYNYGVYSYFKCCQEKPIELINMIEKLGKIMNEEVFKICARERSTRGKHLDNDTLKGLGLLDENNKIVETDSIDCDILLSAAMTYWVTQASWMGDTDPDRVSYNFDKSGKNEREEINDRIDNSKKRIIKIHNILNTQNYIITNDDYIDLIKKYKNEDNKPIWYFDPPYHQETLNKKRENEDKNEDKKGKPAPYEDSFRIEQTRAMTFILSNMEWFIKSDYDPSFFFNEDDEFYHDFDDIENLDKGFVREYLGLFSKYDLHNSSGGMEVIWTRYDGTPESVNFMLDGIKNEKRESFEKFWENKKSSKK